MSTNTVAVAAAPRAPAAPGAAATRAKAKRERVNPFLVIGCGLALLVAAFTLQWFENNEDREARTAALAAVQAREAAIREQQASQRKAYAEREAQARAEQERIAAEEAAEKARKASLLADAESEAKARAEREEMARRSAAVEAAHRAAEQNEDAWKRFYKPSASCKDSANSATIECVNEFVKAKREFEYRRASEGVRQ